MQVIHRKLARYLLPALAAASTLGAGAARAADAGYCQQYAATALEQFEEAAEAGCKGLKYPVWSMDFDHHYQWCLTVPGARAQAGTVFRSKAFEMCSLAAQGVLEPIAIPPGPPGPAAPATPDQIPQPQ